MGVAACIVLVYPLTKVSLAKLCVLSLVTQNGTGRGPSHTAENRGPRGSVTAPRRQSQSRSRGVRVNVNLLLRQMKHYVDQAIFAITFTTAK